MRKMPFFLIPLLLFMFEGCRKEKGRRASAPAKGMAGEGRLLAQVPFEGRIVFQSDMDGDDELYLLTGQNLRKVTDNDWNDVHPRWSPDGRKIAFAADRDGNFDIFIIEANGGGLVQVTATPQDETDPAWCAGGKTIVFTESTRKRFGKQSSLWTVDASGRNRKRLIPEFSATHTLADCSPRGPLTVFTGKRRLGWDVFLFDGESRVTKDLTDGGKSCRPRFSRDGRKIAYVSHEADKKGDVWTMNLESGERQRVTVRNETFDYFPSWSPQGRQIVFCSNEKSAYADKGDWALYLAEVGGGACRLLFDSPGRDVFPDWID